MMCVRVLDVRSTSLLVLISPSAHVREFCCRAATVIPHVVLDVDWLHALNCEPMDQPLPGWGHQRPQQFQQPYSSPPRSVTQKLSPGQGVPSADEKPLMPR